MIPSILLSKFNFNPLRVIKLLMDNFHLNGNVSKGTCFHSPAFKMLFWMFDASKSKKNAPASKVSTVGGSIKIGEEN